MTTLDEREVCPLVVEVAHGDEFPSSSKWIKCPAYSKGTCLRAAVRCAFEDDSFDWIKAADWRPVPGGGVLFAPEQNEHRSLFGRVGHEVQVPG